MDLVTAPPTPTPDLMTDDQFALTQQVLLLSRLVVAERRTLRDQTARVASAQQALEGALRRLEVAVGAASAEAV